MAGNNSFRDFPARFYLEKYYSRVGLENDAFLRAVAESGRAAGELGTVVEIGGGPSLSGILAMSAAAERGPERVIWLDVSPRNLAEIRLWLDGAGNAFDYTAVNRWLEHKLGVDPENVAQRLRSANWELRAVDLRRGLPNDLKSIGDVVGSYFFAEAATGLERGFVNLTKSIGEAAGDGAYVVLAYIRRSQPYRLADDVVYPAFAVDEENLPSLLCRAGLPLEGLRVLRGPRDEPPARPGYEGMLFASGRLA